MLESSLTTIRLNSTHLRRSLDEGRLMEGLKYTK